MKVRFGGVVLNIGDVLFGLDYLEPLLRGHATVDAPDVGVAVAVDPSVLRPHDPAQPTPSEWHPKDGVLEVSTMYWAARCHLREHRVEVRLGKEYPAGFDQFLKVMTQLWTIWLRRGVLLHASAVVDEQGRGVVFTAHSETGKTTLATFCRDMGMRVLSEEMACLQVGEPPLVHNLPGKERNALNVLEPLSVPVRRIYTLVQDTETVVEELDPGARYRALAATAVIGVRQRVMGEPLLDVLGDVVAQVPVKRLRFARSPEFWRAVAADLATDG